MDTSDVRIPVEAGVLHGTLEKAGDDHALVIFAHGSGSGRHSARNRSVAAALREAGLSTLLFDLLTEEEEAIDRRTLHLRFNVRLLGERLEAVTEWVAADHADGGGVAIGYFGASTGAAAALIAASRMRDRVGAVVSRGGRPDLAADSLGFVTAPTLLIVGELDREVHVLNEKALSLLECDKDIAIVPGATHLFEEEGALEEVARLATDWFRGHLLDAPVGREARQARGPRARR